MLLKSTLGAAIAVATFSLPLLAGDATGIVVGDPYARASGQNAISGAAFMTIMNHGGEDDQLISVSTDVAKRAELHTHIEDANGVMSMVHVKDGFAVPADGMHVLERGGDHVMLMGLTRPLAQGDVIRVTLTFQTAGDIVVDVPVDLKRKPKKGAMSHSDQGSGS